MKKVMKNVIVTILFLFLITSTMLLAYLHFFASGDKDLSGRWTAKLDLSERAAVIAYSWLQDIEAVSVSLDDMESYMQGLTVEVDLTMERTDRSVGTFQCSVLPESYDACIQDAYEAFAVAFRELLAERLHMAGYMGGTDKESIDALVMETFGRPTVSYLLFCCPNLLPPLEELQAQYGGSGTYETAEGNLIRYFDDGQMITQSFIRKDFTLVLSEETSFGHHSVIYILHPSDE